jgi:hypothetical protein
VELPTFPNTFSWRSELINGDDFIAWYLVKLRDFIFTLLLLLLLYHHHRHFHIHVQSSVSLMTRLWAEDRDSIPDRGREVFFSSSSPRSDQFWGPPSLLSNG